MDRVDWITHDETQTHTFNLQKIFILAEGRVRSDVFLPLKINIYTYVPVNLFGLDLCKQTLKFILLKSYIYIYILD